MSEKRAVLVTCEHGGNRVPEGFQHLFAGQEDLLATHRGWDPGALPLAEALAGTLGAPLLFSTVSRLLVDLNRSPHHPRLFSSVTRPLPRAVREGILGSWYWPYRNEVTTAVEERVATGMTVVHLSVHTFTPVLDGKVRDAGIGLLYDPARGPERSLGRDLRRLFQGSLPLVGRPSEEGVWPECAWRNEGRVRVRSNRPYRGTSDGFTTALRRRFPRGYLGVELEVNQGMIQEPSWRETGKWVLRSIAEGIQGLGSDGRRREVRRPKANNFHVEPGSGGGSSQGPRNGVSGVR